MHGEAAGHAPSTRAAKTTTRGRLASSSSTSLTSNYYHQYQAILLDWLPLGRAAEFLVVLFLRQLDIGLEVCGLPIVVVCLFAAAASLYRSLLASFVSPSCWNARDSPCQPIHKQTCLLWDHRHPERVSSYLWPRFVKTIISPAGYAKNPGKTPL